MSVRRAVWLEVSGAHLAHGVHRARGVRRQGVHDARRLPALHGARDAQQRAESAQPAVRRAALALQPAVWAGLDAAAARLPAQDVRVQRRAAQAVSDVALPVARHAVPVRRLVAREASGERTEALRAAAEQRPLVVQDAPAQRRAAGLLAEPLVRLLLQEGLPAQAGSAHRHWMHEMS